MPGNEKEPNMPSQATQSDSSVELNDLLFKALDHAVDSVTTGEDLIPFILTEDSQGARSIQRFQTDRLEWSVQKAKAAAGTLKDTVVRYALAYDAYVTVVSERFDTVVIEASERGAGRGWALGQRYRKASHGRQFELVGNPVHLGSVEDRFEHSA